MSVNVAQLQFGIYSWVKAELTGTVITPDRIIWLHQDAPRPPRPYVGLDLVAGPGRVGHDGLKEVTPGVYDLVGIREMTVSVAVYGHGADQIAQDLHSSLEKPTVREQLEKYGLVMIEQLDPQPVPVLVETRWEDRTTFDVRFRACSLTRDNLGYIKDVEVTDQVLGDTQVIES